MSNKDTLTLNDIADQTEVLIENTAMDAGKNEKWKLILNSISIKLKSTGFAGIGIALFIGFWSLLSFYTKEALPGPLATFTVLKEMLSDPFYDYGPNDKGIGLQLFNSIKTVLSGFLLGSLVAIPIGILMGASTICKQIMYPIVQLLKPVSPLAWFPIGLVVFKDTGLATIFIVFITSLWSTLINTSFGIASIPQDHKNVAKAFGFSKMRYLTKILIPFSLPHIITGLRLSISVAWLVIVAGEMLSGGAGIGFFVWDSWNALSLEKVISAIIIIGIVGLLFDKFFTYVENKVAYKP
ncbi:nitrate/nitrite transport system permease protein [Flavobacterium sp. CF108]|jgi:nitrate/nitrite transport system permease protein|uniref:nitrate ABC transporter permease n=1 Tax=unclassified Flavobacterium TaxID=196869 RepID=UPI0008D04BC9|nr:MULTISPECIES: nitrate ABC transporter permease [unclassified Flavobacterium]SEN97379.1 nitrate/nitrite transport system permease protein [Flavobacterium sp. fv08]SHH31906.1 nitrate/nitrite transport system permease protein [Flavobacterium sp. CF108]